MEHCPRLCHPERSRGICSAPRPHTTLASSHADFAPRKITHAKARISPARRFHSRQLATTQLAQALPPVIPIIDTHIHMFDTRRPGGVPWPATTDTALYKPALPERYASIAGPLGVVGAIVVEASPLVSDNDWVLSVAANHPILVGMVGDLIPATPSYQKDLERLHANPLFLGIRYGNLWDRDLAVDAKKTGFLPGLKMLAEKGLVLDSANPDPALIRAIAGVADHLPELRIVIDHLPSAAGARRKQQPAMNIGPCYGIWRKTKTSSSSFLK